MNASDEIEITNQQFQRNESQLVGVKKLAAILDVSVRHIYHLNATTDIPIYRPFGKKCYYDLAEVLEWIKKRDRKRQFGKIDEESADQAMLNRIK